MPLKKSLSQHLLRDKNLLNKLVRLTGIAPDDTVVEIGAGKGDLTRVLARHARFVYAVELDRQFTPFLESLEREFENVQVIFGNALDISFASLAQDRIDGKIKVIGNIPYHITGDILFKVLDEMEHVTAAHFTMQKEVGERLVSKHCSRSYGALSVVFQLYASIRLRMRLKPGLFIPPPEVESVLVSIDFREEMRRPDPEIIEFIHTCFRYKRKYLKHSLEGYYSADVVKSLYAHMGFPPSVRAEELEPHVYERMFAFLKEQVHGKQ
ncbi:MAG: dimethyladenosine transferase [Deltaproteobacteria bacterium]|nr:dimethyladenosine transferase [Deltaproteobacteria bacterium]